MLLKKKSFQNNFKNIEDIEQFILFSDDLYQSTPCGMHSVNKDGIIIRINQTELNWLGYSEDEIKGQNVRKIYSDKSFQLLMELNSKNTNYENIENLEIELVKKNNTFINCLMNTSFYLDEKNELKYSRTIFIDITEKKIHEKNNQLYQEKLKESEIILKKISQNIPGMIYIFKKFPDGRITFPYASDGVINILGELHYKIKEDASIVFKHHHPDDMPALMESMEKSERELSIWKCEYRVNVPHLGTRWLSGQAIPEKSSDGTMTWYGNIHDITTEKELSLSLSILDSIFKSSNDAIIAYDLKGNIISWNLKAESIFEKDATFAIGKHVSYFIKDFNEYFLNRKIDSSTIFKREFNYLNSAGEILYLQITDCPIFDKKNKLIGFSKIARDVSLKKRQEILIQEQQKQLFNASKLSAIGEMAANVAHEINNPLTIINLKLKSQLKNIGTSDFKEEILRENIIKILETSNRIAKIVNSLKNISRDSNNDPMEIVSISKILNESLELSRERIKNNNIDLKIVNFIDFDIECVANLILQVLINLIENSIHAIENLSEKWITVDIIQKNETAIIKLIDSGTGIAPEFANKIMDPFFTTRELGKGSGLGLSNSKEIVAKHSGSLYLDQSYPNTCFVVELPIRQKN